jgi:Family of unknown function (DUF6459)
MRQTPPQLPGRPIGPQVLPLPSSQPRRPTRRPLPDAFAVRRLPLPPSAPQYDAPPYDELSVPSGRAGPPTQAGHTGQSGRSRQPTGTGQTERTEQTTFNGRAAWPSQFAQALAEALAGSRPAGQVRPWTTEQARRRIRQLGPTLRADQRPRVRRVLTSVPRSDVVEMTVIIGIGARVHAMAVRLERADADAGQPWLCTAIEAA